MKRLLVFVFAVAFLGSCTVTLYDGKIYPSNVEFNQPNFIYIKTIKGSAEATFNAFGWDKEKSDGLVNEAKKNMYLRHPLKANQVPTNVTVDILKVGEPNSLAKNGISLTKVRVIITADIFEFYKGDGPIQEFNSEIKNKINDSNSKNIDKKIENKTIIQDNNSNAKKGEFSKINMKPNVGDVLYFEDFYNQGSKIQGKVSRVSNSSWVTLEYLDKKGRTKTKNIAFNLLYKKN